MAHRTRRDFIGLLLGTTVMAPGAALALTYAGGGVPWSPGAADPPYYGTQPGRVLTAPQRQLLDAIVARLIPADENGPGAIEAGVPDFIESQLAGYYGEGRRWYMAGPFPEPLKTQGYQFPFGPRGLIATGLDAFAAAAQAAGGQAFTALPADHQDALLTQLEEGELELQGIDGEGFFAFLLEMTIEGFFSDPVYGGNRDMIGWQLVGFPGARYDYRDFVDHGGKPIALPPVGLMGRPGWRP